jgi:hypothetical protein
VITPYAQSREARAGALGCRKPQFLWLRNVAIGILSDRPPPPAHGRSGVPQALQG